MNSKIISIRELVAKQNTKLQQKKNNLITNYSRNYRNAFTSSAKDFNPKIDEKVTRLKKALTERNCQILDKYNGFKALEDLAQKYPNRYRMAINLLSKHLQIYNNLEILGENIPGLKLDSINVYDTLYSLQSNVKASLDAGIISNTGEVDLHHMVQTKTGKLRFTISEVASLNATTMFVNNSNLQKGDYEVYITGEFKSNYIEVIKKIEKCLPDAEIISTSNHVKEHPLTEITFSDRSWIAKDAKSAILPMSDFKYVTPGSSNVNEIFESKETAWEHMGLKKDDQLLVIPSSDFDMVTRIVMMKNTNLLPENLKIVLLPRTEDEDIDVLIGAQKTGHVSNKSENIRFPENTDIFVSNTRGLAAGYQKVADVVIMPHDRNGWESLLYTQTIAQKGEWKLNPTVSKAINNGAGLWMEDNDQELAKQITNCLNRSNPFKAQVDIELKELEAMKKQAYIRAVLMLLSTVE